MARAAAGDAPTAVGAALESAVRLRLRADVPVAVLSQLEPPEPAWLYWYDHHAFSADPRKSHALHRAAAQVVAKLRAGQSVEGIPAQPRGA